jgi:hypothetical protein
MDNCSFRVYTLNLLTIMVSLTDLESELKILLLLISIVYTSMKIYDWVSNKRKSKINTEE